MMKKLKNILALADPYPNCRYEIFCYVKAILGLISLVLGLFFIFSPILEKELVIFGFGLILAPLGEKILSWERISFGENLRILSLGIGSLFVFLGLYLLWQIKLVRKLIKALQSKK